MAKRYALWLILFGLCLMLQLFDLQGVLRFDRQLIEQGQIWRVFSAHLLHLNGQHFALNMGGLLLVAVFFGGYCANRVWLWLLLWSMLLVSLGLYLLNPELRAYVGLSGVLHALFMVGAWQEAKRHALSGRVLLVLLLAKLAWEQLSGALPGSEAMSGGHVVVNAHLYGAIAGGLFLVLRQVLRK